MPTGSRTGGPDYAITLVKQHIATLFIDALDGRRRLLGPEHLETLTVDEQFPPVLSAKAAMSRGRL